MKPHIFIHIHYLEIGGAETALIGLLQALDPQKVEVDLFMNDHRGEMMRFIPRWVNVLPPVPAYTMIERSMLEVLRKSFVRVFAARLFAKYKYYRYRKKLSGQIGDEGSATHYVADQVTKVLPSLSYLGEYDLAISFLDPPHIVQDKVRAKVRIEWIHTDFSTVHVDYKTVFPRWAKNDFIASVSEDVTRAFCNTFPTLREKIFLMENILSPGFVWQRADAEPRPEDMPYKRDSFSLLTIGRYSYSKKLEDIPGICRRLLEAGYHVKWYIIGYGQDDGYIRDAIAAENMQDNIILLGKRLNPYPYIRHCDWYVQPSRYEGKSVVVREAQILHKPVIITNYPTARSQVVDGVDGVIVPLPLDDCAKKMAEVLADDDLKCRIIQYLSTHDYGNVKEVDKIYSLI